MAYLLGIEIEEIYIYPLGGISKFNMDLNISIKKELLILLAGPIFQQLAYMILLLIFPNKLVSIYHYSILSFNLLPIYPLDGGKLLNLLLNKLIPYKTSLKTIIITSYLISLSLILINININILVTIIFLLLLITKEVNKLDYKYNKFLLERYLNNYNFKNTKIISNINKLYRDNKHLIKANNKYYLEKEYLNTIYIK